MITNHYASFRHLGGQVELGNTITRIIMINWQIS